MNLFDTNVQHALETHTEYASLRNVVEKELMHQDILRTMSQAGFLKQLTFIGGTCLRLCYGSERLSEDLDFSSDFNFKKSDLKEIGALIQHTFKQKYDFAITVEDPVKETGNTHTWKIKIITRPQQKNMPLQRINLDIVRLPSYTKDNRMIRDYYGINSGVSGIILKAESLEEILIDKIIALALRPIRVKNRDLWDIFWLDRKNIQFNNKLFIQKLKDRSVHLPTFTNQYTTRIQEITAGQKDFLHEMSRFLAPNAFDESFISPIWWEQLIRVIKQYPPMWQ